LTTDHTIVIEEASLELVPKKLRSHRSCKLVYERFGIAPAMQVLDRNYHGEAMRDISDLEKRGRPDVVHLAVLDVTSTPLFFQNKIGLVVHTRGGLVVSFREGTRPPRTLERFCGVMAKILSSSYGKDEESLFEIRESMTFKELISFLGAENIISFSRLGKKEKLRSILSPQRLESNKNTTLVVGGFPHGSLKEEVIGISDNVVSISKYSLPAHTVTARICYELEVGLGVS
jgi:rRNA small subunit pseudouridine methyltransferase Nep1